MFVFSLYNNFLHGTPDRTVFLHNINLIRQKITKNLESDDPQNILAAENLEKTLPNFKKEKSSIKKPTEELFAKTKTQILENLTFLLPDDINDDQKYDSDQIRSFFLHALARFDAKDWKIKIVTDRTAINVNQEEKTIQIPKAKKEKGLKVKKLIFHEIGAHVQRAIHGENSKIQLLSLGLDRYLPAEEGIATVHEQILGKKFMKFSGQQSNLAIGLAHGVDGIQRDFRQVFEIIYTFLVFNKTIVKNRKKTPEEIQNEAREAAWTRCIRTFRGTDCHTPGVYFGRDLAYREGNIKTWKHLAELDKKDKKPDFYTGKYDPTNIEHTTALKNLEIL